MRNELDTEISEDNVATDLNTPVLVVDLDGTLLRSDMLHETFWNAISRDWRNLFPSITNLFRGRASLKRYLSLAAEIDVSTLPYDAAVMEYVDRWRASGGRTALVTASDEKIANAIAEYLELFDEVHGSDGVRNLKGVAKAEFLEDRFSESGFSYVGDSIADIPVWKKAKSSVTVNASKSLRKKTEELGAQVEHLQTNSTSLNTYIRALRPHQWLKNLLVFLPLLTAQRFDAQALLVSVVAFIAFSVIASSVYVLNDLLDLKSDRLHIRKRCRPFASGEIPIAHGVFVVGTLVFIGGLISSILGIGFVSVVVLYFATTLVYSLYFKRVIVLDICVLAFLYTIRIVAGGVAGQIELSVWLLAFSVFIFFSLAAIKRQAELVDMSSRNLLQASGRGYHVTDLPIISQIAIASGYVAVLVMALYLNSPVVAGLYSEPSMLWGICFILLYWITRIALVTHRGLMNDDPVVYATKDVTSLLCFALILFCVVGASVL